MKQLTTMLATAVNLLATSAKTVTSIALALFISIGSAHASSHTAVTANLVKSQTDENLLICQYQTISASHFQVFDKVLDNEQACPTNIQVAPEPMLSDAEEAQLKQMFSRQSY
ncbi:hypothetical protein [uncultured Shewanella sp.]|uniref:hypothetical protein n=1 Tax=uncultured Shewanella sp. TaxID=173975 RepID=UPI0026255201|nr:hypothetical protein [uncultured Shewanella sp.]